MQSAGSPGYSEKIIGKLGIGAKRIESAPPGVLFSTDLKREKFRQEIRKKIAESQALLEKRVGDMVSLDGRPVIVGQEKSAEIMHFDFEAACSGVDAEGNVFVSTSDSKVPDGATLFFIATRAGGWAIEPIPNPNLGNAYLKSISEEEEKFTEEEKAALQKG